jgi:hypothetical protein
MSRSSAGLCTALALTFALGTAAPTYAAPLMVPANTPSATSDVMQVQNRRFHRRGNRAFYNGHRGYRERRRGYRRYNGFWFPPSAFIAGAIIGGAISRSNRSSSAHVSWCYDRWRSYRASDNTYQPTNGPRRECISPYN